MQKILDSLKKFALSETTLWEIVLLGSVKNSSYQFLPPLLGFWLLGIVLDAIILGIPQLMTSIAKLEKKFKDIERQNLIQNSCRIQKPKKKNVLISPFWGPIPNRPKSPLNRAELAVCVCWHLFKGSSNHFTF